MSPNIAALILIQVPLPDVSGSLITKQVSICAALIIHICDTASSLAIASRWRSVNLAHISVVITGTVSLPLDRRTFKG
jgi:hypothetical protein